MGWTLWMKCVYSSLRGTGSAYRHYNKRLGDKCLEGYMNIPNCIVL